MKQLQKLRDVLKELGISYTEQMIEQFAAYRTEVLEWNEKVNLTAIKDPEEFELKHFIDSVMVCGNSEWKDCKKIIDVGTGAGFPGVPLAILYPEREFVLMDSLGKRIKILEQICEKLGILNVSLIHARAEELARKKEYRAQFDLCLSRAVANLAVLAEYCIPFVKCGGYFAAYKTAEAAVEIRESEKAVSILGGSIKREAYLDVKGIDLDHQIVWIKKEEETPAKYPRKAGTPSKEPLK